MSHAILIVEDEATLAKNVMLYLQRHGYEAEVAGSAEEGLAQFDSFKPDAVLLDLRLPGMDGLTALSRFLALDRKLIVILITGHGSVENAVDAMKIGAYDFLTKPVALSKLKVLLDKALGEQRREAALSYYQDRDAQLSGLDKLIGDSEPMRILKNKLVQVIEAERKLIDTDMPAALITGETGVGKELVARALHFSGSRQDKPFVEINCAAIPAQLLESELFGHERGAFTDARERKLGLVETASGGTLFLDEIGDMDLGLQAKLLRLLEEKTVRRVGGLRDQKVDVRIVAATHRPLAALAKEGKFRADLFFRLRIIEFDVPPLRERGADILLLAQYFLGLHGHRYGRSGLRLSAAVERLFSEHRWPGNVRELRNVIEQAVLLSTGTMIEPDQVNLYALPGTDQPSAAVTGVAVPGQDLGLDKAERELLVKALDTVQWNVTRAAKLLGITRDKLRYRMEKFSLTSSADQS